MSDIYELYEKMDIDARNFAQERKGADYRMKRILENAFYLGEQHVLMKMTKRFNTKEILELWEQKK